MPCLGWLDRTYHTQVATPSATALIESQLEAAELELLKAGNPPSLRIRYLMRKGNAEFRAGKPDAAIADLTEALALTEQAPPRKLVVSNIHNLRALGLKNTLSRSADFSGISKNPLYVNQVFHAATIDVATGEERWLELSEMPG